jgi:hypothetical protein
VAKVTVRPAGGNGIFPIGPVVDATRLQGPQSEVSIAVNPLNPNQVFIGANDGPSLQANNAGMVASFSKDGGATWSTRVLGDGTDGVPLAFSDPSVAWDNFGNLFYSYVEADGAGFVTTRDPILMSTDGGATFQAVGFLSDPNAQLLDQESLAVGPGPGGQGEFLWSVAADFPPGNGPATQIAAALPILGPGQVGTLTSTVFLQGSGPFAGSFGTNFNSIAVGPQGQVAVMYQDDYVTLQGARLLVSVDPSGVDGTFGPPTVIAGLPTGRFLGAGPLPAQPMRGITMKGGLAWDLSPGPHHGRLYAVYTNTPATGNTNSDIFLQHSDDGGQSWSAPLKVNDDNTNNSQFWPRVAVDQTNGNVAVSWYDCRNDLGRGSPGDTDGIPNDETEFFAAVSFDGGVTFEPNLQLEPQPSSAVRNEKAFGDPNDYGDYTGLAFDHGVMHPAWADNSGSLAGQNPDPDGMDAATVAVRVPTALAITDVEPNDTSDRATKFGVLPAGSLEAVLNQKIANHRNGLPDYDWFRWSAGAGGSLTVTFAAVSGSDDPLELHLFTLDANNTLIELGSVTSVGNTVTNGALTLTVGVRKDQPILVEVKGGNTALGDFGTGTYDVEVGLS